MDGIPALDLWDLIIEVLLSHSNRKQKLKPERRNLFPDETSEKKQCNTQNSLELTLLILFPQTRSIHMKAGSCTFFEDNEAVIKMIIKGRSLNLRHVSRTHRVALDWLFDRIILDPKIRIRCVDSKNQLADILTQGHFTRDEWNHLPCLFNISLFSSQMLR